mmetsp:Transcript_3230/g.8242  ORF Transcript_3230/g.8242 Transcript_3230/m.8242 type:complete len:229 (-) Transcript_3230:85-771(-)
MILFCSLYFLHAFCLLRILTFSLARPRVVFIHTSIPSIRIATPLISAGRLHPILDGARQHRQGPLPPFQPRQLSHRLLHQTPRIALRIHPERLPHVQQVQQIQRYRTLVLEGRSERLERILGYGGQRASRLRDLPSSAAASLMIRRSRPVHVPLHGTQSQHDLSYGRDELRRRVGVDLRGVPLGLGPILQYFGGGLEAVEEDAKAIEEVLARGGVVRRRLLLMLWWRR